MSTSRRVFVAGLALAAGQAAAQAPVRSAGPDRMLLRDSGADMERLAVLLDLNEYQQGEMESVLREQQETLRREMQALHRRSQQETRDRLQTVLTESQLQKLDLLMDSQAGGFGAGPRIMIREHR